MDLSHIISSSSLLPHDLHVLPPNSLSSSLPCYSLLPPALSSSIRYVRPLTSLPKSCSYTCSLEAEADDRKRGYNSMQTIDVSMEDMEVSRTRHFSTILLSAECHAPPSPSFALLYRLCEAIEHTGVFVICPSLSSSYSPFLSYLLLYYS